ncbi:MAG: BspA family leucine-rich repeat surface protein [Imperialibacter sp.]|uniref:BspA family leucine-rich repeat surface protein n=1 Tax=Imperialibacter sp. TaxID=2038411 RepID=UPI0032EC57C7
MKIRTAFLLKCPKVPFVLFLLLMSFGHLHYAQVIKLENASAYGTAAFEFGQAIAIHNGTNNVYTTGRFFGTVDFDPSGSVFNLTSVGDGDIFVLKQDEAGNFLWAINIGGSDLDTPGDIAVDASGNFYITGWFRDIVDFDPGVGTTNLTAAVGGGDVFVAKYDANGDLVWAKSMLSDGLSTDSGAAIAVDGSGNVYTAGSFDGTTDFDPGVGDASVVAQDYDSFFSKLDANGDFVWVKTIGGSLLSTIVSDMTIDASGNIYAVGTTNGVIDLDPGIGTSNMAFSGTTATFLLKLDAAGVFQWGNSMVSDDVLGITGLAIGLDASDQVYTVGYFAGVADFDPTNGPVNVTATGSALDAYISKHDDLGGFLWGRTFSGTIETTANSLVVSGLGDVTVAGYFDGTTDFDPSVATQNITSAGSYDIFIVQLDPTGDIVSFAENIGSSTSEQPEDIAIDGGGRIYLTGLFDGTTDLDPNAGVSNFISAGSGDIFIASYSEYKPFITTWQTTGTSETITIPTTGASIGYSYSVTWEEVGNEVSNNGSAGPFNDGNQPHSFVLPTAGLYRVYIAGDFPAIYFDSSGDRLKIQSIEQWGDIAWADMNAAFAGCNNLIYNAIDAPDLSNVLDMSSMFSYAGSFDGDLSSWDVSNVENMRSMFEGTDSFNGNITNWQVGAVTDMYSMFSYAISFNQDIGGWDVGLVEDMAYMFSGASSFDIDISGWQVGNVTNMFHMFEDATIFNQDIGGWDVSQVFEMRSMFSNATAFDQNLGAWDIGSLNSTSGDNMLDNSGLSKANYDALLVGWADDNGATENIPTGLTLGVAGLTYCSSAADRQVLITNYSWTFVGDTEDCPSEHCASAATDAADSKIVAFSMGGVSTTNALSCETYTDYSSEIILVAPESVNAFSLDVGTCGGDYDKIAKIFVDWNNDFVFSPGELVYTSTVSLSPTNFSDDITVPIDAATNALLKLRIVLMETTVAGDVQACGPYDYGETEDYSIYVSDATTNAGVTAITSPLTAPTGDYQVKARITNVGQDPIQNFTVSYEINPGAITEVETFTGTINPLQTQEYAFTNLANLASVGTYQLAVSLALAGDEVPADDVFNADIEIIEPIAAFPYFESFESGDGGWMVGGSNPSWGSGFPSGSVINDAADGAQVFTTSLESSYNENEDSYIESPFFDVSGLTNPTFRFSLIYDMNFNAGDGLETFDYANDIAYIEYSSTDGLWHVLGQASDPNWYNVSSDPPAGTVSGTDGWSDGSGGWQEYSYNLSTINLTGPVRFRVRFVTNETSETSYDGVGFDKVYLYDDVPSSLIVTSTADAGPGTLRQAILDASTVSVDTIRFNLPASSEITVLSTLDIGTKQLVINGYEVDNLVINGSGDVDQGSGVFGVRLFNATAPLTLSHLGFTNVNYTNPLIDGNIGALLTIKEDLNIEHCSFFGNTMVGQPMFHLMDEFFGAGPQVLVNESSFTGNSLTGASGTIFNILGDCQVLVDNSVFDGNVTDFDGGAIYAEKGFISTENTTFEANEAYLGGAVAGASSTVYLVFSNSTFNDNGANSGGAISYSGNALVTISRSTISGNSALNYGGGIEVTAGSINIYSSTITLNQADFDSDATGRAGGIYNNSLSDVSLYNTILAGNLDTNYPDGEGSFSSSDYNLIGDNSGMTFTPLGNDLVGNSGTPIDALLEPLADNGGPTLTHLPGVGSPAIDAGSPAESSEYDQRGAPRFDGNPDIGSVEAGSRVPTVIYVNATASGLDDGTSWADAFVDLQDALAFAISGDQIWLANGVYLPDGADAGNTSLSFVIAQNDLEIFGGFDATETDLSQRFADPAQTVLSGDLNGDDDFNFTNMADNSNNVLIVSNVQGVFLDGFTISGGNATTSGGGIYSSNTDLSLNNMVVEYNQAGTSGGGVYITSGEVTFLKTHFQNNNATVGGGVYLDASEPFIYRSIFQYNSAVQGAGLYLSSSNLTNQTPGYYNKFIGNSQNGVTGGGLYLSESYYEAFQNLFAGNFAYDNGGAAHADYLSTFISVNSTIVDNSSNDGSGGLSFDDGAYVEIQNTIFWGNTSVAAPEGSQPSIRDGGSFTVENSIVEFWDPLVYSDVSDYDVFGTDPNFVDGPGGDYGLLSGSSAIDLGNNLLLNNSVNIDFLDEDGDGNFTEKLPNDLANNPRYTGLSVDLGAFEFQAGFGQLQVVAANGEIPTGTVSYPDTDVVVAGLSVSLTDAADLDGLAFTTNVDLSASLGNYRLYHSTDALFGTTGDNTLIGSSPFFSMTDLEFASMAYGLAIGTHYIFLVADAEPEANPTQPGIQFSTDNFGIDVSSVTVEAFSYSGPSITFDADPLFTATLQNATGSEVNVSAGTSDITLMELLVAADPYGEVTGLKVNFSSDPDTYLENYRLVISLDNSLATLIDNDTYNSSSLTAGSVEFSPLFGGIYTAGRYYFLMADVATGAGITPSPITFSVDDASFTATFGTVTGIDVSSDPLSVGDIVAPATPTALSLSLAAANEVDGSFVGSGASGYLVIRRPALAVAYSPVDGTELTAGSNPLVDNHVIAVGPTTVFTDAGLANQTDYTYDVYAYNGSGAGIVYSTTALTGNITTLSATPVTPTALNLSLAAANEVNGSFTGSGALGYLVIRRPTAAVAYSPVTGTELTEGSNPSADNTVIMVGAGTTFTDSGLSFETDYTYDVFGYNGGGSGIVYSVNPLTGNIQTGAEALLATEPLSQPTALVLSLEPGRQMSGNFTAAADGAEGYLVLRYYTPTSRTVPEDGTEYAAGDSYTDQYVVYAGSDTSFTDDLSGVELGTVVDYDVYAYNGTGAAINYLTTEPLTDSRTLEESLSVIASEATGVTTYSFLASWDSVASVSGYLLEVATDELFASQLTGFNPSVTTDTSATVSGLYHATDYFYRVRGYTATDTTAYSNTITTKTLHSAELTSDSTALVKIYDEMGGAGWSSSGNWKVSQVRGWAGVAVTNSRVTALNLASNNVTGAFPILTGTELNALQQLDLANNQVTLVPANTNLAALQVLDLSSNQLDFGSLEQFAGVTTFSYSPQGDIFAATNLLQERGESLTLDRTSPGASNLYQWYKNGTSIDGATAAAYTIAFPTFAEEGSYAVEVRNSLLPNLTLNTLPITLRVSSLERDRLVLTELYTLTAGDSWTNKTNWNTADITSWFGITVENDRVTGITLPSNNLAGDVPARLGDMRRLTVIDLNDNEISSLPALTNIIQLNTLDVRNNRLQFDDLEPNIGIASMTYAPQKLTGQARDEKIAVNTEVTVEVPVGGTANSYQWYRNGSSIAAGTSSTYQLGPIRYENMGSYELEITNSKVAGLSLRSEVQRVLATAAITGTTTDLNELRVSGVTGALLGVKEGAYDTTGLYTSSDNGVFTINSVILGDYLLYGEQDKQVYIPSYYRSTIDWVFADLIQLRDNVGDLALTLVNVPRELTPADGDNTFKGLFESDFGDTGGRVLDRKRVQGAGVSVSRSRFRAKDNEDEYELIAYVQTDETGQFEMNNLPDGDYRVNIQYPGIPMDPTSFVDFQLGGGTGVEQNSIRINALATPTSIVVTKVEETGIYLDYFKGLTAYPNPAADYITIRYEKLVKGSVEAELIDMTGQTLQKASLIKGQNEGLTLDVTKIRNGMYILRFHDLENNGVNITSFKIWISK